MLVQDCGGALTRPSGCGDDAWRRADPGPSPALQPRLVEAKLRADARRAVRQANLDLLGYRHDYADQLDGQREPYGIGCVFAAGLSSAIETGVALCTPDTLPEALAAVGLC